MWKGFVVVAVLQWSSDLCEALERSVEVWVEWLILPSQLDKVAEALMAG